MLKRYVNKNLTRSNINKYFNGYSVNRQRYNNCQKLMQF